MKSRKITMWKKQLLPITAALVLAGVRTASAVDYPTTILADNPLAYYRLEETSGAVAADSSATHAFPADYITSGAFPFLGWPGIDTNGIALSSSQFPDYVSAGYYPELNQPGPFSFEIWARPVSTPTGGDYRCPIGNSAGFATTTLSGWYVYQTPSPGSTFALVTPTGDIFITSPAYTINNWYYLAGTYDGTNMSFYINGVLIGTQLANAYTANSVNNAGACTFALGQRGAGYGNWDGQLDEAAYYTNALSLTQIQSHYQVGTNSFRTNNMEAPLIFNQPAATTVNAGQTVQFNVLVDGATPLKYQWYKGATSITGATNAAYSFTTVLGDNGNTYSVAVTNDFGYAISTAATLTVNVSLEIVAPLTSITRTVGSAAVFEVVTKGAGPITYQWHNGDDSIIPGATNNVLWLYNVQLTNDGSTYYVGITNPSTGLTSDPATLNVQARPVTIPVTGYGKVVMADGPIGFWQLDEPADSTTAIDTAGSFDGTYIPGAGSFNFGVPSGIPHDTNTAVGVTGGATVSIPFAIEINPVGSFTWEGWFNPASLAANGNDYRTVFCSMSNPYGAGNTGWLVYQTFDNHWAWWPRNGFYAGISLTDNDTIVANQWYYLTLAYDGTTFTLYVNGVAKASGTDSGFVQNGNVPPGGQASYNYNYNTTPGLPPGSFATIFAWRSPVDFQPFSGIMDDIAVYNKALTPSQIQNHFLNTTHLSVTSSGNNIVVSWPVGTLQSASTVTGPYTTVSGATSPYSSPVSGSQKFFRVQIQ